MSKGLFSDLLVIDCASFIAGPAAATIMSDFGARVIKIEPPGAGDSYRNLIKHRGVEGTVNYFWLLDARNKESIALDLKRPEARAVLEALIRKADVFITNYPFPVRERLKLRAEDVLPHNKRIIYASMSPYGELGPERDRTAFDNTAWWARTGLMDLVRSTGEAEPAMSVSGMGDHPTAVAMYAAIVTALYKRQITGEGGEVNTSLLANGLWANGCQVQAALCDLEVLHRPARGARNPLVEYYESSDGRLFNLVLVNFEREWPLLARALGHPEWLEDARYSSHHSRAEHSKALTSALGEIIAAQPWDHWKSVFTEAGIAFGIVGRVTDHASDPQIAANHFLREFDDGSGLKTVDSPFLLASEPKQPPRMAPDVGQHTLSILRECGLGDKEIAVLTG